MDRSSDRLRLAPRTLGRAVPFAAWSALLALGACAPRRSLDIRSAPPGALVRLDDRIVGETPMRYEFDEYGVRRVTLYKDGYRPYTNVVKLRPPWYARFPLDYVSELLLPFGWRDRRQLEVALEEESGEVTLPDLQGVLDRAELFRLAGPDGPQLIDVVPMEPEAVEEDEDSPPEGAPGSKAGSSKTPKTGTPAPREQRP